MERIFVMLFSVNLPEVPDDLQFYRLMFARDEEHLKKKVKVLIETFGRDHDEIWHLDKFWDMNKVTFEDMHDFVLTDEVIGWEEEE